MMRPVLIYRSMLLPYSETFIFNQASALRRYVPYYLGLRRTDGITLPAERCHVVNEGGLPGYCWESVFRLSQRLPHQLCSRLCAIRPALIHAHFATDAVHAVTIANALGIPLLVTLHGYDVTVADEVFARSRKPTERLIPRQRRRLLESDARYLAVSNFIMEAAIKKGMPAERIQVHYIGVDVESFTADHAVHRKKRKVLFVGRLVEKKGCQFLISAMAKVQARVPDAELVVIGDGPLRGNLESQAKRSLTNCCFLGAQPNGVVQEQLRQSRVFCVPSVVAKSGDAEGFGIVFIEAQAMGVPVVSFATGGICDAVADGETGFLETEGDVDGLAGSIGALLCDDDLWLRFSSAGRIRTEECFSLHRQTEKLERIYDELLNVR